MDDRVIVVGGGLAGLVCAGAIARGGRGQAVTLLDAAAKLGGRAATSEHGGYQLNHGAHALYQSSERLLAAAGVEIEGERPKPHGSQVLRAGALQCAPLGPRGLLDGGPLSLGERLRLLATTAVTATLPASRLAGGDSASWAARQGRTPALTDLLRGLLRLSSYCGDLQALPAEIGVGMLQEAMRRPVRYVSGGWGRIVDGLTARAEEAGVEIRSGARVVELLVDGAITGVRLLNGEELRARAVVLAGLSPARANRLILAAGGDGVAPSVPRPLRAACLDVALSELPRPGRSFVLGLDEPLYLSVHSRWSQLGPRGGAVVHLMRYEDDTPTSAEEALERLESLFDQAQPGWRERVVHSRFAPRMTVVHHLPALGEGLSCRPGVRAPSLPGVYLAGDWVGPRGWLAGASLQSAVAAATALLGAPRRGARHRGALPAPVR